MRPRAAASSRAARQISSGVRPDSDDGHPELAAEGAELILGGRPVGVGGGEDGMLPLLGVHAGELGGRRRLARALQPHEHDDGGRGGGHGQAVTAAAQELDQLVVDDLDHLLGRVSAT